MRRYGSEAVLRFNVSSAADELAIAAAADRMFLDIWAVNDHEAFVDVRLRKDRVASLLKLLPASLHHAFINLMPDLAAAVRRTHPNHTAEAAIRDDRRVDPLDRFGVLQSPSDNSFFQSFQPLPVIVRWMGLLESMFRHIRVVKIGLSAEGRDILGLRISTLTAPSLRPRRTILLTAGLHAREWISTSTVAYLAWAFISANGKNPMVTAMLDEFDMVFVPVANPDGYEYTWNVDRLWKKTRQPTSLHYCRGLDLDHAFGFAWDSSHDEPCSESYGGEEPFQAVEARTLALWAQEEVTWARTDFAAFLDFHSYAQQVMYPFSYTCRPKAPNYENQWEAALLFTRGIRRSSGETYHVSSACREHRWPTQDQDQDPPPHAGGGSALDWFYHELRVKYSYKVKLRDTGGFGFLLPSSHIIPTGEEIFLAMQEIGDFWLGNNGIEHRQGTDAGAPDSHEGSAELRRRLDKIDDL